MKHTPTPWTLDEYKYELEYDYKISMQGGRYCLLAGISKENAEYIVQCVNSHDELLEALKQTDATLVSVHNSGHFDLTVRIEQVRKAIQKAEGK